MIFSLFISVLFCFKGTKLVAGAILLTVKKWASESDMPFIMGHAEDELSLAISTKILSIVMLEPF
jgi:hypothetical protein